MKKEKTIKVLNELIGINTGRIEGYQKASEFTEERELKGLFSTFVQTSKKCLSELESEIKKMGGNETNGTTALNTFFRAWMEVKTGLAGKDRTTILNSCELGEENVVKVYNSVLTVDSAHISHHQQDMIKSQINRLKSDQKVIVSMQNTLVETQ